MSSRRRYPTTRSDSREATDIRSRREQGGVKQLEGLKRFLTDERLSGADFLEAVERVAESIEDVDDRAWALYQLVKELAATEQWDRAEAVALIIGRSYEKASALRQVALCLIPVGRVDKAGKLLAAAECAALERDTPLVWQKAEVLTRIAMGFAKANLRQHALRVWEMAMDLARSGETSDDAQESIDSSSVLWEIAENLAAAGYQDEGNRLAHSIKNSVKRHRAIDSVEKKARGKKGPWDEFET
jgi:tetratricopeptide (TPR) repeat protein